MFIVLGVTGGIAAYKSVFIARQLVEAGHEVHVIPTEDSLRFVGIATWEAISRNPVTTSVHDDVPEVRHVALGQRADLIVIAPATAHTLASMAAGLANTLLGTTLLASKAPVLVAPAMHTEMWEHPATVANIATLRERGVHVIGPESGRLTGADSGPGRMSEPDAIVAEAFRVLDSGAASPRRSTDEPGASGPSLTGIRVLVSAGGTREPIDPVRYLGNRSSGKQGVEIAVAAAGRGAIVDLVAANIESSILARAESLTNITIHRAGSALELQERLDGLASVADVVIMAAAVADYRVADVSDEKITKEGADGPPTLTLVENPDVLAGLTASALEAGLRDRQLFVAFAAETTLDDDELLARARRKRARKQADFIAVNRVGWTEGFESETNTLTIVGPNDEIAGVQTGTKRETADALLDAIAGHLDR